MSHSRPDAPFAPTSDAELGAAAASGLGGGQAQQPLVFALPTGGAAATWTIAQAPPARAQSALDVLGSSSAAISPSAAAARRCQSASAAWMQQHTPASPNGSSGLLAAEAAPATLQSPQVAPASSMPMCEVLVQPAACWSPVQVSQPGGSATTCITADCSARTMADGGAHSAGGSSVCVGALTAGECQDMLAVLLAASAPVSAAPAGDATMLPVQTPALWCAASEPLSAQLEQLQLQQLQHMHQLQAGQHADPVFLGSGFAGSDSGLCAGNAVGLVADGVVGVGGSFVPLQPLHLAAVYAAPASAPLASPGTTLLVHDGGLSSSSAPVLLSDGTTLVATTPEPLEQPSLFVLQPGQQQLCVRSPSVSDAGSAAGASVSALPGAAASASGLLAGGATLPPLGAAYQPEGHQGAQPPVLQLHRRSSSAGSGGPGNNALYKTELCRSWRDSGSCRYGARCQFAHGEVELRPVQRPPKWRTQPCRTWTQKGSCPYGDRCHFIHGAGEPAGLPPASTLMGGSSPASSASAAGSRGGDISSGGMFSMGGGLADTLALASPHPTRGRASSSSSGGGGDGGGSTGAGAGAVCARLLDWECPRTHSASSSDDSGMSGDTVGGWASSGSTAAIAAIAGPLGAPAWLKDVCRMVAQTSALVL